MAERQVDVDLHVVGKIDRAVLALPDTEAVAPTVDADTGGTTLVRMVPRTACCGSRMPTPSSSRKLVAPAAQITRRVRIVPRSVTTPTTAPPAVSIAVTPQPSKKRAPASAARAANAAAARRGSACPSVAVNSPPSVRACGERPLTRSSICARVSVRVSAVVARDGEPRVE